jgi:serine/threonine-protein kinase
VTRDQWEAAVALFEEALTRAPEERDRFLETAASNDPDLRGQVAAMLLGDSSPNPVLDASPDALASLLPAGDESDLAGHRIGPYRIVRALGRGGAATVYLATDEKHHRSVALKVLHAEISSALGGDRFRREIDVVAQLQHPHILPLHDSGEVTDPRDGHSRLLYYVMPLVRGETLRDRIAREGPLPIADVDRIVADVSAALDYAHRHGVIHRDIKPANILLDESHATVADFGIARRALGDEPEELTSTGVIVGTPAYMSPEQSVGERALDARSDIYALGCVTFEMLTGSPPFRAATSSALVAKHLQAEVPSARAFRAELPDQVDDVIRRAMAKDSGQRFASTRELADALHAAFTSLGVPPVRLPSFVAAAPRSRRWASIAVATAVVAIVVAGWLLLGSRGDPPSIAVLPFTNLSDDRANEYFSDGVTEELTGALADVGGLRVTPRTTAFGYKGRAGDITRIGRDLGVTRILEGSVRLANGRVRIIVSLYDVKTGERLWHETYERDLVAVLPLQTELAATIADHLERRLLPAERTKLAERHTTNPEAYNAYLRGRYFFDKRTAASVAQAAREFERALAIDSTYARAYAGLADSYSIQAFTGLAAPNDLFVRAERAARRAIELDSTLADAHVSLSIIHFLHDWDWAAAEREAKQAVALDSTLALAWFFRSWPLVSANRYDEALTALRRARALEPLSLIDNARMATLLAWMRRYDEASTEARRTLEIDPTYPVARVGLARLLSLQGRHAEAIAALPPDSVRLGSYESGIAGFVYARAGRRDAALAAARALEARAYVPGEGVAAIYGALGDTATALTWLERAVASRGTGLVFLEAEPMYDALRGNARYDRVVERIGLVRRSQARKLTSN